MDNKGVPIEVIRLPDGTEHTGRLRYDDNDKPIVEIVQCGTCGFKWNDALISDVTPTPSGRCPNEYGHASEDDPKSNKLAPKDAALVAFIHTVGNTGGVVELTPEESVQYTMGAQRNAFGCKADREWTDLAAAYLLACEATGTEPIVQRLPKRPLPIAAVEILLTRSAQEDSNDDDTDFVHSIAAALPEEIKEVRVLDCDGTFLYFADGREGE